MTLINNPTDNPHNSLSHLQRDHQYCRSFSKKGATPIRLVAIEYSLCPKLPIDKSALFYLGVLPCPSLVFMLGMKDNATAGAGQVMFLQGVALGGMVRYARGDRPTMWSTVER